MNYEIKDIIGKDIITGGSGSGKTRFWLDPKEIQPPKQNQAFYNSKRRRWWLLKWIKKKQPNTS